MAMSIAHSGAMTARSRSSAFDADETVPRGCLRPEVLAKTGALSLAYFDHLRYGYRNDLVNEEAAMGKRLSRWLRRVSTGWVALATTVIFLLFTAWVLPAQADQAEAETGGAPSPDTSFFYTPAALYAMAEAYGASGRQAYVRARFTFDLVWPVVYTVFLATTLSWLYGRAFPEGSWVQLANLAPVIGALLDYLENVSTSLVMIRYPARTPVVALLAPFFTAVKWIFVGGSLGLLAVGMVGAVWRAIRPSSPR